MQIAEQEIDLRWRRTQSFGRLPIERIPDSLPSAVLCRQECCVSAIARHWRFANHVVEARMDRSCRLPQLLSQTSTPSSKLQSPD